MEKIHWPGDEARKNENSKIKCKKTDKSPEYNSSEVCKNGEVKYNTEINAYSICTVEGPKKLEDDVIEIFIEGPSTSYVCEKDYCIIAASKKKAVKSNELGKYSIKLIIININIIIELI